jgi:hypothetical protein
MADGARLESIEALTEFEGYLSRLREELLAQCDAIAIEYQRVDRWLHAEAWQYWRSARHRSEQRMSEARDALAMCRAKVRPDDYEACSEQQKQYEKARRRLQACEEKLKQLKAYQLAWEQLAAQGLPRLADGVDLADARLPRAQARLVELLDLLEKYRQS